MFAIVRAVNYDISFLCMQECGFAAVVMFAVYYVCACTV